MPLTRSQTHAAAAAAQEDDPPTPSTGQHEADLVQSTLERHTAVTFNGPNMNIVIRRDPQMPGVIYTIRIPPWADSVALSDWISGPSFHPSLAYYSFEDIALDIVVPHGCESDEFFSEHVQRLFWGSVILYAAAEFCTPSTQAAREYVQSIGENVSDEWMNEIEEVWQGVNVHYQ